jgi:hypothetical protein
MSQHPLRPLAPGAQARRAKTWSTIRTNSQQKAMIVDVKRGCAMKQVVTPHVIAENRGHPGLTAGFWGCILAVLGITSLGVLSVPIAIVCTLVGLVRGIVARDATSIGTSLLAACLCVVGFASSPLLLAITALLATNTPSQGTPAPHSLQQGQQRRHLSRVCCTGDGANRRHVQGQATEQGITVARGGGALCFASKRERG